LSDNALSADIDADNDAGNGYRYGRKDCVVALTAAIARCGGSSGGSDGSGSDVSAVTVREGRGAQRVLDGLLRSGGEWIAIDYD
jgi:hypothetical protein